MANLIEIVPKSMYFIQFQQLSDITILFIWNLISLSLQFKTLIDVDTDPIQYARLKQCGRQYITFSKWLSMLVVCFISVAILAKYKNMEKHLEVVGIKFFNKQVSKMGYARIRMKQIDKFRKWYISLFLVKLFMSLGFILILNAAVDNWWGIFFEENKE